MSLNEDGARTKNLCATRATLHVITPELSAWTAVEADSHLSQATTSPGDETGGALAQLCVHICGTDRPGVDEHFHARMPTRARSGASWPGPKASVGSAT